MPFPCGGDDPIAGVPIVQPAVFPLKTLRPVIYGRVQSVLFRQSMQREAQVIPGWVRASDSGADWPAGNPVEFRGIPALRRAIQTTHCVNQGVPIKEHPGLLFGKSKAGLV